MSQRSSLWVIRQGWWWRAASAVLAVMLCLKGCATTPPAPGDATVSASPILVCPVAWSDRPGSGPRGSHAPLVPPPWAPEWMRRDVAVSGELSAEGRYRSHDTWRSRLLFKDGRVTGNISFIRSAGDEDPISAPDGRAWQVEAGLVGELAPPEARKAKGQAGRGMSRRSLAGHEVGGGWLFIRQDRHAAAQRLPADPGWLAVLSLVPAARAGAVPAERMLAVLRVDRADPLELRCLVVMTRDEGPYRDVSSHRLSGSAGAARFTSRPASESEASGLAAAALTLSGQTADLAGQPALACGAIAQELAQMVGILKPRVVIASSLPAPARLLIHDAPLEPLHVPFVLAFPDARSSVEEALRGGWEWMSDLRPRLLAPSRPASNGAPEGMDQLRELAGLVWPGSTWQSSGSNLIGQKGQWVAEVPVDKGAPVDASPAGEGMPLPLWSPGDGLPRALADPGLPAGGILLLGEGTAQGQPGPELASVARSAARLARAPWHAAAGGIGFASGALWLVAGILLVASAWPSGRRAANAWAGEEAPPDYLEARYGPLIPIARGGMGDVYGGRCRETGAEVVVKTIRADLRHDPQSASRFLREMKALTNLDHPHIVKVREAGTPESPYLVMTRADESARPLSQMLGQPPAVDLAVAVGCGIGRALSAAHAAGILHRDVKPGNILVDSRQHVTLIDFGLAFLEDSTRITRVEQIVGTVLYMAPEMLNSEPPSAQGDVYSLGAVLYECLTGRAPHADNPYAKVLYPPLASPSGLQAEVPPDLAGIVMRCLERPDRRFGTAGELVDALERWAAGRT